MDLASVYPNYPAIAEIKQGLSSEAQTQKLDLGPFMSPTPYTIQSLAPLSRVMAIFRPMGLRHLPVVDKSNHIVGMVSTTACTRYLYTIVCNPQGTPCHVGSWWSFDYPHCMNDPQPSWFHTHGSHSCSDSWF